MKRAWPVAILTLCLAAAGATVRAAEDGDRVLVYTTESWTPGQAASADDAMATAAVVAKRCAHAGFDGVKSDVAKDGKSIEVRLPQALAASEAAVRQLVERRGDVYFRVRASEKMEDEYRGKRLNEGTPPPEGYAWVPDAESSLQALVETPEAPAEAKLRKLGAAADAKPEAEKDAAEDEVEAATVELWTVCGESVFTNQQIASSSVQRAMSTIGGQSMRHVAVQFELKEDRKAAFERFTGANVGRALCVVVEGKVLVAPLIKAAIPGAGLLRASGTGWTEEQAREMAAILESGPLPCRLVPAKEK